MGAFARSTIVAPKSLLLDRSNDFVDVSCVFVKPCCSHDSLFKDEAI